MCRPKFIVSIETMTYSSQIRSKQENNRGSIISNTSNPLRNHISHEIQCTYLNADTKNTANHNKQVNAEI